jgi:hypothetical protein
VLLYAGAAGLDQVDELSGGAMNRNDTHRAISVIARTSHSRALYAVGYLTQTADQQLLDDLLEALEEFHQVAEPRPLVVPLQTVDELLAERFGR